MRKTLVHFGAGAALLGLASGLAQAASMGASVAYDPKGLSGEPGGAISRTAEYKAAVETGEMLTASGEEYPYHTMVMVQALADATGPMTTAANLWTGGLATAKVSWTDTIRNQSQASQNYLMNMHLYGQFQMYADGPHSNADFRMGYQADVLVDGVLVWHSAQTVSVNNYARTLTKEGFDIGGGAWYDDSANAHSFDYIMREYQGAVNLGSLAAGKSAKVTYNLSTFGFAAGLADCGYYTNCSGPRVSFGDMAGEEGPRITLGGALATLAPVPEPETYAMLLGGLGLVGLAARRRKARAG